jgi:hypothetical protein
MNAESEQEIGIPNVVRIHFYEFLFIRHNLCSQIFPPTPNKAKIFQQLEQGII